MPAKGILSDAEIEALVERTLAHGGLVSHKTNPDGTQSVYELNITLFDALSNPRADEPEERRIDRFMVSQAIMLAMAGVPGIYVHSLVGSSNNLRGVQETGRPRTINRQKWRQAELEAALADPASRARRVFRRYRRLLRARRAHPAFHPNGRQSILFGEPGIFALWRTTPDEREHVLCLHNVTSRPQTFSAPSQPLSDLISGQTHPSNRPISLAPYQSLWLAKSAAR